MKSGKCPKCNSSNVYQQSDGIRPREDWVMLSSHWGKMPVLNPTKIDTYLCVDCGYFENYVPDKDNLSKAAKIWDKVG